MKRNLSIDYLRVICSILVVFIHVSPPYSDRFDGIAPLFLNPVFRVSLPLFFMISGYFILNSSIESLSGFYLKRIKSIVIPFIIFSFIHYAFFHQWDSNPYTVEWFKNYLLSLIKAYPENTGSDYFKTALYWFVYTIIGLYIIAPILAKLMHIVNAKNANFSIAIILALFAWQQFSPNILSQISISKDWFRSQTLNEFLVYFVLGGIVARMEKVNALFMCTLAVFSYFVVVYQQYLAVQAHWFGKSWIDANLFMMLLCTAILAIVHNIKITSVDRKVIYFSSLTYGIYLIQIVTISLADSFTKNYKDNYLTYTLLTGTTAFTLALIISMVLNPVIKKI